METLQFKTNIKCSACVAKVSLAFNETAGENNWNVDTVNPDKVLTVSSNGLTENDIKAALQKAGYKAEKI